MATKTPTPITLEGGDSTQPYDRAKAVKQFDESNVGVEGLVNSGIQTIPPFSIHPPETLSYLGTGLGSKTLIPTVDLSGIDESPNFRPVVVDQIRHAASTLGLFQIINHGIPLEVLNRTIASIKAFHEQPTEIKARVYCRKTCTCVSYLPSVDAYNSKATSWRDVLQIRMGSTPLHQNEIPEVCRAQVMEWIREITRLGEILMGLLSEGLGLSSGRLKEMGILEYRVLVGNYYRPCPQPDHSVGLASHTDPKALTVLLQDHIGGLQVRSGEGWLDVRPIPGALIINIGDFLQVISNELYKSPEHRVLANSSKEPRVSLAVFFNPTDTEKLFGPLPELTSAEKPALYRNFTLDEFVTRFLKKESDGKSFTNYFRQ